MEALREEVPTSKIEHAKAGFLMRHLREQKKIVEWAYPCCIETIDHLLPI